MTVRGELRYRRLAQKARVSLAVFADEFFQVRNFLTCFKLCSPYIDCSLIAADMLGNPPVTALCEIAQRGLDGALHVLPRAPRAVGL